MEAADLAGDFFIFAAGGFAFSVERLAELDDDDNVRGRRSETHFLWRLVERDRLLKEVHGLAEIESWKW